MTFSALQPLMIKGAAVLRKQADDDSGELLSRCADGLEALAGQAEIFDDHVRAGKEFLDHFGLELQGLEAVASLPPVTDVGKEIPAAWDTAFALFEDITVFVREKVLRTGFSRATEEERRVLKFFEGADHWKAGDGTLVSEAYYVSLPTMVLHDMLMQLNLPASSGLDACTLPGLALEKLGSRE